MSDWIEAELAECQMHDARHTKRLGRLLDRLSARPVNGIPTACHGWAETMAAYRFLDNPDIGIQEILSGHTQATLQRIRAQEVVLLVQDTTFLDYGTTHPKAGMGTVKIKTREEYLLHPTVVFTPERVNIGVVGMKVWQRPEQPVAQQRTNKPLAEKESYRWLEGYHGACAVKQACPTTLVVNMADRAGGIQAWFVDARRREPGQRAAWIIRAKENHRLAPGATQRYWWAERQQTCAWGPLTIDRTRQPERPPRSVTLAVTATPVTSQGARRPGGKRPPVTVSAVSAQEASPPQGEAPMAWPLLTNVPGTDFSRACAVVQGYRCRRDMARFSRVLTQGCQIEPWRMQTEQRLRNALAIYVIVAWRIHHSTMASRAYPAGSREGVFAPRAWHTL